MDFSLDIVISAFVEIFAVETIRYMVVAALILGVISLFITAKSPRNLHADPPTREQKWREFRYSMLTCAIFALNGLYIFFGIEGGWVKIYDDPADYGALYWVISFVALVLAHDAWFYWTHRLLHMPWMFRRVHHLHHKSQQPTVWAAYAFAPFEAFINGTLVPIFVTLVPINGWAVFLFLAHMMLRNVMGHSGYELFPRYMPGNRLFGFFTNVYHHDLHHRDIERGNYGLYFVWWDRLMGTEHPDYTDLVNNQRQARQASATPSNQQSL